MENLQTLVENGDGALDSSALIKLAGGKISVDKNWPDVNEP